MKLLKRPFVAVLLCAVIVLGSSVLSAYTKLDEKARSVTDSFYTGVRSGGETLSPIAAQLEKLCGITDNISLIAANYGKSSDEMDRLDEELTLSLKAREQNVSLLYGQYSELNSALKLMEDSLYSSGLSERHSQAMTEYSLSLQEINRAIAASGYNDSVQGFRKTIDRFPSNVLMMLFGIEYPAYFG